MVRLVIVLLSAVNALFVTGTGAAYADRPTVIDEDKTGFACDYFAEGAQQVSVSINFDRVSGQGYSFTDVLSPDGNSMWRSFTDDVVAGDGIVSARYPLLLPDGSSAAEVVLEGMYASATDPITLRNRVLEPHRLVGTATELPLLGGCATAPLTALGCRVRGGREFSTHGRGVRGLQQPRFGRRH